MLAATVLPPRLIFSAHASAGLVFAISRGRLLSDQFKPATLPLAEALTDLLTQIIQRHFAVVLRQQIHPHGDIDTAIAVLQIGIGYITTQLRQHGIQGLPNRSE